MRNDSDDVRQYTPVLRRIIILVAVLTAVPVVMWTITAFVRSYVGPPTLPTFQPMAASSVRDVAAATATASLPETPASTVQEGKTARLPAPVDPNTTDAHSAAPDASKPPPSIDASAARTEAKFADTNVNVPAPTTAASVPAAPPVAPPAAAEKPDTAISPTTTVAESAAPQAPVTNWPAVDLPSATAPLAGPIPLPRQRPHLFAMAQAAMPLPRPRPASAGPTPAPTPAGPLDWLQNVFQPHQ